MSTWAVNKRVLLALLLCVMVPAGASVDDQMLAEKKRAVATADQALKSVMADVAYWCDLYCYNHNMWVAYVKAREAVEDAPATNTLQQIEELKKKRDLLQQEVPAVAFRYVNQKIAQARLLAAEAELANCQAQLELQECQKKYDEEQAARELAKKIQDDADREHKIIAAKAQGKDPDSDEVAAEKKARSIRDAAIMKFFASERPVEQAFAAIAPAQRKVKGDKFQPVINAETLLRNTQRELEKRRADADSMSFINAVHEAREAIKKAHHEYDTLVANDAIELGTEKAVKIKYRKLAKLVWNNPEAGFFSRCCQKIVQTRVWRSCIAPNYALSHFKKEALMYEPADGAVTENEKIEAFKKAVTKQALDYATAFSRTLYPSLMAGLCVGGMCSGAAYKFLHGRVLGNRLHETIGAGVCSGALTTLISALTFGYRHGLCSFGQRRKHIIETAKKDKIAVCQALNALEELKGTNRWQALKKYGLGGVNELSRIGRAFFLAGDPE